jgi:probable phosphoglycerate mutase
VSEPAPGGAPAADAAGRVTRLLLVRHGQTAWNAEGRIQGHRDIGLDATGLRQAAALAGALAGDGVQAIYSSDLSRARQTAAPLVARLGQPLRTDPGLRERAFGIFEGLSFAEVDARWPAQAARWRRRDPDFGAEGGETLRGFRERLVGAVLRLAAGHAGEQIVLVTHGGALDLLYREATRLALDAPRTWPLANAAINRLLHADQGLVLVGWGDVGHLDGLAAA